MLARRRRLRADVALSPARQLPSDLVDARLVPASTHLVAEAGQHGERVGDLVALGFLADGEVQDGAGGGEECDHDRELGLHGTSTMASSVCSNARRSMFMRSSSAPTSPVSASEAWSSSARSRTSLVGSDLIALSIRARWASARSRAVAMSPSAATRSC